MAEIRAGQGGQQGRWMFHRCSDVPMFRCSARRGQGRAGRVSQKRERSISLSGGWDRALSFHCSRGQTLLFSLFLSRDCHPPSLLPTQTPHGADVPAAAASRQPQASPTSSRLCIPNFGEKSPCLPICSCLSHHLSKPELFFFSLPVALCFLMLLCSRALSKPCLFIRNLYLGGKRTLLRQNRF